MKRPDRPRLLSRLLKFVGVRREPPVRQRVRAEVDTLARWARRGDESSGSAR